jgi:hypothetical protein
MAQTRLEIARAAQRLALEPLITVDELAGEVFAYSRTLIRWITEGKGGVHLDGIHRPGRGWLTSRAAYARFSDKLLARSRKADAGELARPERTRRNREGGAA